MNTLKGIVVFIWAILLFPDVNAQDDIGHLKNHEGHVAGKYSLNTSDYVQNYTPQEEDVTKQRLVSFTNYLQSYNSLKNPQGFEVLINSGISSKAEYLRWSNILYSQLFVDVYPWYMNEGKPTWKCNECSSYFSIYFNRLDKIFNGYTIGNLFDNDGIIINTEPVEIGEESGCKVYSNGIIVVSNGKPLWVPVTVREYNEAVLRKSKKELDEGLIDALMFNMVKEKIKEEESAYSPTELNGPAYEGDRIGGCPYRLEGARAFVKLNKYYFDKAKPRTALQLIILEADCIQPVEDGNRYFRDEYSSVQHIKVTEILKDFNYSDFRKFLE